MTKIARWQEAERALGCSCPILRGLIKKHGSCAFAVKNKSWPAYLSLMQSVAYQQLHANAAAAIFSRFQEIFPEKRPLPELVLHTPNEQLRGCGLSMAKIVAIKDIAAFAVAGKIPERRKARFMTDEDIIAQLVEIKGIGRWTAEMFLMFHLGRPDILSPHDFGIRKGIMLAHNMAAMPTPAEVKSISQKWQPWRTVASWYLWRAAENGERNKQNTQRA